MTHRTPAPLRIRPPLALAAATLAAALAACAGTGPSSTYGQAQATSSLEVPPDLTQVRQSDSTRIPGAEPPASARELEQLEKYRKFEEWAEFEQFLEWKKQRGDQDEADFETFRAAKYGTAKTLAGRVLMEPTASGYRLLRVYGDMEQTWSNVGASLARMDLELDKSEADERYYLVRYATPEERAQKRSGLSKVAVWSKPGQKYRIALEDHDTHVVVTVRDKKGGIVDSQASRSLLDRLYGELESYARLAGPLEPSAGETPRTGVRLEQGSDGHSVMLLPEGFPRAWRRVGITLARVGFTVEERNREDGVYVVRYVDDVRTQKTGLSRLAFWQKARPELGETVYRIALEGGAAEAEATSVRVRDSAGAASDTGDRILELLYEEVKTP